MQQQGLIRFVPDFDWKAVIALLALVQPWAIAAWKKFFGKGKLAIHESGTIDVGFGGFGPVIGVEGVMRATRHDSFVSGFTVELIRDHDSGRHKFDWVAFRSPFIGEGGPPMERPAGFMVSTSAPKRFTSRSVTRGFGRKIQEIMAPVREEWRQALIQRGYFAGIEEARRANDPQRVQGWQNVRTEAFALFNTAPSMVQAYSLVQRQCYWEPGTYTLTACATPEPPTAPVEKKWRFSLTSADAERLRLNVVEILRSSLDEPLAGSWNVCNVKYLPFSEQPQPNDSQRR